MKDFMKYSRKKCAVVSIMLFVLFANLVFGMPFPLPEWFINYYSDIIRIIFLTVFLFVMKYFHGKKCLTVFIGVFILSMAIFMIITSGTFNPLIEKVIGETPEAKVSAYVEAIAKNNREQALDLWKLPEWQNSNFEGYNQLKERREKTTNNLLKAKTNSDFTVTHVEWWSTCCVSRVINDSNWANGARVHVQLTDSNGVRHPYIFDVFVWKGRVEPGISSVRYWAIRDIYPENQEPLFWTRQDGVL